MQITLRNPLTPAGLTKEVMSVSFVKASVDKERQRIPLFKLLDLRFQTPLEAEKNNCPVFTVQNEFQNHRDLMPNYILYFLLITLSNKHLLYNLSMKVIKQYFSIYGIT